MRVWQPRVDVQEPVMKLKGLAAGSSWQSPGAWYPDDVKALKPDVVLRFGLRRPALVV